MLAIVFPDTTLIRTNLVTNPFWQKILQHNLIPLSSFSMLLNRQEFDEINLPGCNAAQGRFVIVFYHAFCLWTVEINVSTARFAPTPMICFYLKRLVSSSRR